MLIVFAILPFFSTLLGGFGALRLRHRLHPFMACAAGVLVSTALTDLLPEAGALVRESNADAPPFLTGAAALAGFLVFSALDAFVHRETWEHAHQRLATPVDPDAPHDHATEDLRGLPGSSAHWRLLSPASLVVHSLLDGLAIGLAFRAGGAVGLLVGLAVLAHDFADGMNVVTLTLSSGSQVRPARAMLFLDALAPSLGAALGTFVDIGAGVLGLLLATFAGVFLAVGAGHLLPEAAHQRPAASPQLIGLATVGGLVVIGIRAVLG